VQGLDSPVSKASSVAMLMLAWSLRSAGTISPVASCTTSPGTRSSALMLTRLPLFRTTRHAGAAIAQRLNCLLCTVVLKEADDNVQDNDGSDDTAFDGVSSTVRKGHCDSQNECEAVRYLPKENLVPGHTTGTFKLVVAVFLSTQDALILRETCSIPYVSTNTSSQEEINELVICLKTTCDLDASQDMSTCCYIGLVDDDPDIGILVHKASLAP
jgi:hypothetical protein